MLWKPLDAIGTPPGVCLFGGFGCVDASSTPIHPRIASGVGVLLAVGDVGRARNRRPSAAAMWARALAPNPHALRRCGRQLTAQNPAMDVWIDWLTHGAHLTTHFPQADEGRGAGGASTSNKERESGVH